MYLGIDVGGTKTLLAVFDAHGRIVDEHRFPTNPKYPKFIAELDAAIKKELGQHHLVAACCAVAGYEIDRQHGIVPHLGNLAWTNIHMVKDLQKVLPRCSIYLENDAKLAGLSEALAVKSHYKKVLYVTVGTGIGIAHVVNGRLDHELSDKGGRGLVLKHDGELMDWDDIASGKALVRRFGKTASQITDPKVWAEFSRDIARGLEHFVEETKPEIIIMGGGVGSHFNKFGHLLNQELAKLSSDKLKMPVVIPARRPQEAVIYGCYDYIKQNV